MDGLIREAQRRGCSLPPPPPSASPARFSAVICQQALENKRGRQEMKREIIRFTFTLIEPRRKDIKVGKHHGKCSQSHGRATKTPGNITYI